MINYFKLIRVKHWLKNLLILLPLFFSQNILNVNYYGVIIISFLVFSFSSSMIYIVNDLCDLENDRLHPIKKNRVLASGKISIKQAKIVLFLLIVFDLLLMIYLYIKLKFIAIFSIPIIYIFLNILYSYKLKNIPIIDIVILVLGFVFRLFYGSVVVSIKISMYLYLLVIFGSCYLALGKRRNEIIHVGEKSRKVLTFYNKEFLEKNMYLFLSMAMFSYILWCIDKDVINRLDSNNLFFTIPLVIIIFFKYNFNIENGIDGDPVEVVFKDKILIYLIVSYIFVMMFILY